MFYQKSAQMISSHLAGICNYFISHATSGVMSGINNKIKLIKRQGYGFTNFENFRIKLIKRQGYGFTNFENFRLRLLACFSDKKNLSL
ncbi:MAG: transposase [Hormoscilla sp. SP5CHS1]|nr:transposase [Hormoscilla sp. SP5CHS1]